MKAYDSRQLPHKYVPNFEHERELYEGGARFVTGVDEAGRGPLAGPVVVAAVILNPANIPVGLNDSKKLSEAKRDILSKQIFAVAHVSIASAPPSIIKSLNIRGATLWAMKRAISSLPVVPDFALIDGRDIPQNLNCPADAIVKGDMRSVSIAAASIIAKVTRDQMCQVLHNFAPAFGFDAHKGYGTAKHLEILQAQGPITHHRLEFGPVARANEEIRG